MGTMARCAQCASGMARNLTAEQAHWACQKCKSNFTILCHICLQQLCGIGFLVTGDQFINIEGQ